MNQNNRYPQRTAGAGSSRPQHPSGQSRDRYGDQNRPAPQQQRDSYGDQTRQYPVGGYGQPTRNNRTYMEPPARPSAPNRGWGEERHQGRGGYGYTNSMQHPQEEYVPPQTQVAAPSEHDLNNPGKCITPKKILAMTTLSIQGEAVTDTLTGLEQAFLSDTVKSVYITPREGKNLIVAAPAGYKLPESSSKVAIRMLSKQAMKKLREM